MSRVFVSEDSNNHNIDVFVRGGQDRIRARLETFLQHQTKDETDVSKSIIDLYKAADDWLSANNQSKPDSDNEKGAKKSVKPKKKNVSSNSNATANDNQKQGGMKTAEDVIKRLRWDKSLPAGHFTIGYLDRFVGVVEKPFGDFHWDIVNAELTDLAIPQHRIQYFKYKTSKVWDKNDKLDLIFNSLSAGPTVYEVMKVEDDKSGGSPLSVDNSDDINEDNYCEAATADLSNDDNIREEETVTVEEPLVDMGDVPKGVRPDYFLAIPIDDPIIKNRISMVQDLFKTQFPKVIKTLLDLDHLHVTVALFTSCDNLNGITDIITALRNEENSLRNVVQQVQFKGLQLLADRVLCSYPDNEFKETVMEPLKQIFNKYKIKYYMSSIPHLTMGKINLSKDRDSVEGIRNLISVSRFNGCQSLNQLVLRPVGIKDAQNESTFILNN